MPLAVRVMPRRSAIRLEINAAGARSDFIWTAHDL